MEDIVTEKTFSTRDLWLAGALTNLLDEDPTYRVENDGQTVFCFVKNDDLYKALSAYNEGIAINAYRYAQTVKKLKAQMLLTRRNGERK